MPLPVTAGSELTATTVARKWKIDVDTSALQDGSSWLRLMGQTDCTVNPGTAGMQSDTDYDGGGYASSTATTLEWNATATVRRAPRRSAPTTYDPAQEFIRARATSLGPDNTVHIRAYEYSGASGPLVESYEGYAASAWAPSGGDPGALSMATITLTGQGALLPIAHPAGGGAAAAPTVTGVAVGGTATTVPAAGGGLVTITGSGFLAATAVVVGGVTVPAATDWEAQGDTRLALKAPAHAAGAVDVVVTNPGGTSGTSAATKLTYV